MKSFIGKNSLLKMSLSVIFLMFSIFAVSQGATNIGDSKNGHTQSDIQVTRSPISESSIRNIEDELRNAHLKLQVNQIDGSEIGADKQSRQGQLHSQFNSQDFHATGSPLDRDNARDQSMFQSQRNTLQATTTIASIPLESGHISDISFRQQLHQDLQRTPENQQFLNSNLPSRDQQQVLNSNLQSRNQQNFYEDKQQASDNQQFYNARQPSQQLFPARQQTSSQQQFYNLRPSQQDQTQNFRQQSLHDQTQNFRQQSQHEQTKNFRQAQQHQTFNARNQSPVQDQLINGRQQVHEQQKIYTNVHAMNINNQGNNLNHQFQGVSVHQSQIPSDRPVILSQDMLTQIQTKGIQKDVQLSAYDNREHGLTLPRGSSVHSSSVVVSGLKNLPMLPALVYNGGAVPSSHGITYGRDGIYKGSASLRQHMQTPYVRYVYGHIL